MFKRVILLSLASLVVSIGSYTQFPSSWIYFGILHFFLLITIIGLPFLKIPKISLVIGIFIIIGYNMSWLNMHWFYNVLQELLNLPKMYTQDLVSLVPWFGVYLLGLTVGHYKIQETLLNYEILHKTNRINTLLSSLGKHSFIIYMLHQIVLFSVFYLIKLF
ncbi:MAG: hypothetical protein SPLUMA1_SPLUMAMAG1_00853 [uncultured Sulfurimonas sp.]|nr:MAG: hypothetical protein SPLUMA1_SPLUMAMAG1_00853 [uncultured Sulfurimonas sp.]